MRLIIQQTPFLITAEVLAENGTLLGSFPINDINNFVFTDIKCVGISSGFGGTFYVKDFTMSDVSQIEGTVLSISTEPLVILGSQVKINGSLTNQGVALANELIIVKYTFPGAEEWYPIGSAYTDENGNYNIQWISTATGTFTLRAEWKGDTATPVASASTTLSSVASQKGIFLVESNSTISLLEFNSTTLELSFAVSGPSGTTGYIKATIAKSLVSNAENMRVYLDGNQLKYELASNGDSWVLSFTYTHSTHQVSINLSENPERTILGIGYWVWTVTLVLAVFLTMTVFVYFKRRK
jgi:hypothetical protein